MTKTTKDIAASFRARLLNIARSTKRDFDALLLQYIQERFLYRLSISPYRKNIILKGALLFLAYKILLQRPTKDIDFLGFSTPNEINEIRNMVVAIAGIDLDDGVKFDRESVIAEWITEDNDYKGVRVKFEARLTAARKILQLDILVIQLCPDLWQWTSQHCWIISLHQTCWYIPENQPLQKNLKHWSL